MPEQLTESWSLKHIHVFMFIKVTSSNFPNRSLILYGLINFLK